MKSSLIKKALIPCAGHGSRMRPITYALPKEMLPLNCYPGIWYCINECIQCGINDICIIYSKRKAILKEYLINTFKNIKFTFVVQTELNGLAKAIYLGKKWANKDPFLLIMPDNFFNNYKDIKQMISCYNGNTTLFLHKGTTKDTFKYSMWEGKPNTKVFQLLNGYEKPGPSKTKSRLAGYWRAIITYDIFNKISSIPPGVKGEYQLTDAFVELAKENKLFGFLKSNKTLMFDTGTKENYANANLYFTKNNIV